MFLCPCPLCAGLPLPLDDQTTPPQVPLLIDDLTFKPLSTTGFVPYYNYEQQDGALAEVSGTVGLLTSDDAGRVASQTFMFMLSGVDSRCKDGAGDAHNSCGLHIHQGGSCKEDARGHFFNGDGSFDPWAGGPAPIVYTTTDDFTFGEFTVLTGLPAPRLTEGRSLCMISRGGGMPARGSAGPADEQGGQRRLQLAEPPEEKKASHFLGVLAGAAAGALAGHLASQQDKSPHYGPLSSTTLSSRVHSHRLIILAPHTAILSSSTVTLSSITVATVTLSSSGTPGQGNLGQSCTSVCRERRLTCDIQALDEFARTARTGRYTSFNVNSLNALTRQCRAVNSYPAWPHSPAICNSPACGSTWRYNSFGGCSVGHGGSGSCNLQGLPHSFLPLLPVRLTLARPCLGAREWNLGGVGLAPSRTPRLTHACGLGKVEYGFMLTFEFC